MARIVFNPGLSWGNLPPARRVLLLDQDATKRRLAELRGEWQEAAGPDLGNVTLDLAGLFDDFTRICGG